MVVGLSSCSVFALSRVSVLGHIAMYVAAERCPLQNGCVGSAKGGQGGWQIVQFFVFRCLELFQGPVSND